MKIYVKPSIEVIELQLKEDIAAVPTTVYRGKGSMNRVGDSAINIALFANDTGLTQKIIDDYNLSNLA